jgi:uncharacterized protein
MREGVVSSQGGPGDVQLSARPVLTRYLDFCERHTKGMLTLALLAGLLGAVCASRLALHTDMSELLPDSHPAVMALRDLAQKQRSASSLIILVRSRSRDANQRFANALRPEIEGSGLFSDVQWAPDPALPAFRHRWRWLYAPLDDLGEAERLVDRMIARQSPLFVDLEDDPETELRSLERKFEDKAPAPVQAPFFERADGDQQDLGIMLWRARQGLAGSSDRNAFAAVRAIVAHLGPTQFDPGMTVEFTGHIPAAIEQQDGIRDDLTLATAVCVSLILLSIFVYFGRPALLVVIGAPAVLGLVGALALAQQTLGFLNANTAFLISIILGNGINTPIIVLARYGEERRRDPDAGVKAALRDAIAGSAVPTGTATLAACIAYGSLLVTSFRGFNQFGLLGGSGMLLVWLCTFALLPPLVFAGERLRPDLLTPRPFAGNRPFAHLGRFAQRRPATLALAVVLVLAALALPLRRFASEPLQWDLRKLQTDETASQRLWARAEELGMNNVDTGYLGSHGALMVDRPDQADAVADALLAQDQGRGANHVLKTARTLDRIIPSDQPKKLAILSRIRTQIDRHLQDVHPRTAKTFDAWRPPDDLRPITIADLPPQVLKAFTEVDGTRGRLILIGPDRTTYSDWDGHALLRFAQDLRVKVLGKTWVAASAPTVFAGMLEAIRRDGPRVTAVAAAGVCTLIFIVFGVRSAAPVLMALAIGIAWQLGCAGLFGLKLNFLNFVALPITLGVGADYASNMWARLRRENDLPRIMSEVGSAVALCSITTIIGYSSLLLAHNGALRSFGLLADLGEITCLSAALIVLPATASWRRGRR